MTHNDNRPGPGQNYGETAVFTFGRKAFFDTTVRALTVWIKGNKGLRGEGVEALLLEKNKLVKQSKSFPRGRKSSTHMEDWMNVEELIEKSIKSQDVQGNFTCCMPYGGAGV